MGYQKALIIDHEGPSAWMSRIDRRAYGFQKKLMRQKLIPIQPDSFKFGIMTIHKPTGKDLKYVDRKSFDVLIHDTYFQRLSAEIWRYYTKGLPGEITFYGQWIAGIQAIFEEGLTCVSCPDDFPRENTKICVEMNGTEETKKQASA